MAIRYDQFVHPSDIKARQVLEKIPGFKKLAKEYMEIIHEKAFYIQNMSGKIRLGLDQLPDIYYLMIPICDKLGIDVPELFLELDRTPNAYTLGDTDIAIVITSGLIETLSYDEIQIVLAHECGHILCHHTLYHTMGRAIVYGMHYFENGLFSKLINSSMQIAFYHWLRCSEFSADRVAAYFAGSSDLVSDVMMRLAGGTKNLGLNLNKEIFLQQASKYKDYIMESNINKAYEACMFAMNNDHPLLAYRAFEITEWCNSEDFYNIDSTIVVDIPEDSTSISIDQYVIDKVTAKDLLPWFRYNNPSNEYTNILIHCGICKKNFNYLKKLSFNTNKTIYQAIVDANEKIVKHRLVLFASIDISLKDLFIKNDGYIIVK